MTEAPPTMQREVEAMSQGMQAPLEAGKDEEEMDSPMEPPEGPHLDFSPAHTLISAHKTHLDF